MDKETKPKPIFILGSGRSGTSILTAALKSGAGIPGFNEGHFLPLVSRIVSVTEQYFHSKRKLRSDNRHLIAHVNQGEFKAKLIEVFRDQCERICPEGTWLDKSPGSAMIEAVPYLSSAWPRARYIFAKRRGIENLISRLKKFPHVSFERHCIMWAECMEAWLKVRETVQDSSIEIDQRDIALYPERTAMRIGKLLKLDSGQVSRLQSSFTIKRPQSTGGQESEEALDIRESGWTVEQLECFRKHCGEVSIRFGYTETSDYSL